MKHLIYVLILAGCEGLTSLPEPSVSVLRQTDAGCFALMTATPVDPALDVPATCTDPAPPQLFGGADNVEVVIDYGPDVDFAGSTSSPVPTVSLTVDGATSSQQITISGEHRVGGRAYYIATFIAPPTPSTDMQITAGVDADFQTVVPEVFTIVLPPVTLELIDCTGIQACELAGSVGSAHIKVSVMGEVPQTILVHTLLDGFLQPDTLPPLITEISAGHTEHTTAIPVPAARDGAQWEITAQLGAQSPTSVTATIIAPTITTELSCGNACAASSMVGLTIKAPALISPLQAIVDVRFEGVPQIVAAPVELVVSADGTATGLLAIPAPSTTGTWQIDASVAGYAAPSIITQIQ